MRNVLRSSKAVINIMIAVIFGAGSLFMSLDAFGATNTLTHNSDRFGKCVGASQFDGTSAADCAGNGTWVVDSAKWGAAGWGVTGGQYGAFDCSTCHQPRGTNIKGVKNVVTAPIGSFPGGTVIFSSTTGTNNSFGDDTAAHTSSQKICEVCHSRTQHHDYSSSSGSYIGPDHNSGADCATQCHLHSKGFFGGDCSSCHGYPPVNAGVGSNASATPATGATGATAAAESAGAHSRHVTSLGMGCQACHNNSPMYSGNYAPLKITMGYSINASNYPNWKGATSVTTGSYIGGSLINGYSWTGTPGTIGTTGQVNTCNLYCHGSSLTVGAVTWPSWTGSAATQVACGSCHGGTSFNAASNTTPTQGSHAKHATSTTYGYTCNMCHKNGSTTVDYTHVNGSVAWGLDTTVSKIGTGATYSGAASGSTGNIAGARAYAQCGNLYCHSNGARTGTAYQQPTWGTSTTGQCGTCHGVTSSNLPASSAHGKHAGSYKYSCSVCHTTVVSATSDATTTPSILATGYQFHVDTNFTVSFDSTNASATYSATTANCTNLYCHSKGTSAAAPVAPNTPATWAGAMNGSCTSCHNGDSATNTVMSTGTHTQHVNNAALLGVAYTCDNCHKATVALGQNRTLSSPTTSHVNKIIDVVFSTTTNTFNATGGYTGNGLAPTGTYGNCNNLYCHSNGQVGTAVSSYAIVTWGSGVNLGCNGCHGIGTTGSNVGYPNYQSGSAGTNTANSHPKHAGSQNFNCSLCHIQTTTNGTTINAAYNLHINGNGQNVTFDPSLNSTASYSTTVRTCSAAYCHSVGNASVTTGLPAVYSGSIYSVVQWGGGSMTCSSCHGRSNTSGTQTGAPDYTNGGAGTIIANSHPKHMISQTSILCSDCHYQTTTTNNSTIVGGKHINGTADVTFNTTKIGSLASYTPGTGSKTCSNVSCHSVGTTSGNPQWGGQLTCSSCHGFPPATGAHSTHVQDASQLTTTTYGGADWYADKSTATAYVFGCGNCHPQSNANHGLGISYVQTELTFTTAQANPLRSKNATTAAYSNVGSGTGKCSAVYCHSAGNNSSTAVASAVSPSWNVTMSVAMSNNTCAGCHGNPPNYASAGTGTVASNSHYNASGFMGKEGGHMVTVHYDNIYNRPASNGTLTTGTSVDSSHGNASVATTMGCYVCHAGTVPSGTQIDTYAMNGTSSQFRCSSCHTGTTTTKTVAGVIANKANHVNGQVDILFPSTSFKMKAQLRTSAMSSVTTTRVGTYGASGSYDQINALNTGSSYSALNKTCTVDCHFDQNVQWGDQNVTCLTCHTTLP
jgi:predicted CxxxxCH...CXXCH cytochrome family protein